VLFQKSKFWNKVASEVGGNGCCNHSTTLWTGSMALSLEPIW